MFLTVAKIFIALLRSDGFCAWTDFALGQILRSDGSCARTDLQSVRPEYQDL